MKTMIRFAIVAFFAICLAVTAYGADEIRAVYNGIEIEFDQPPVIEDNRTLVPVRAICEAISASVSADFSDDGRIVTISKGDIVIKLEIDSDLAAVNGKEQTLDAPAKIIGERTMVPIRFISETFGLSVDWDEDEKIIIINHKQTDTGMRNVDEGDNELNTMPFRPVTYDWEQYYYEDDDMAKYADPEAAGELMYTLLRLEGEIRIVTPSNPSNGYTEVYINNNGNLWLAVIFTDALSPSDAGKKIAVYGLYNGIGAAEASSYPNLNAARFVIDGKDYESIFNGYSMALAYEGDVLNDSKSITEYMYENFQVYVTDGEGNRKPYYDFIVREPETNGYDLTIIIKYADGVHDISDKRRLYEIMPGLKDEVDFHTKVVASFLATKCWGLKLEGYFHDFCTEESGGTTRAFEMKFANWVNYYNTGSKIPNTVIGGVYELRNKDTDWVELR